MGPKQPGQSGQSAAGDLSLFAPPLAGSGFSSFPHLGRLPQGQSSWLNPLLGRGPSRRRKGLPSLPWRWACLLSEGVRPARAGVLWRLSHQIWATRPASHPEPQPIPAA